jgi:hypothetical protein
MECNMRLEPSTAAYCVLVLLFWFCCSAVLLLLFCSSGCSDVLVVLCTERDGLKGKSLNALKKNDQHYTPPALLPRTSL